MDTFLTYGIIFVVLLALELAYFRIADKFNIIDKPNERSSHSSIVLRGGGIIFMLGLWIWAAFFGFAYPWFLAAVTLVAGVSFVDDIRSLPDSVRLVAQFAAMGLMFYQLDMLHWEMWWLVLVAFIVCVGASNVINFMDGINGITGGYALASLIPIYILNKELGFAEESLVVTVILADIVFCLFNFRPKGRAKCFAGDVGSIGIAFILLFLIGRLAMLTGEAHRKHAYQLMANELKIGHVKISLFYMCLQLAISLAFVLCVPNTAWAHWAYLIGVLLLLTVVYVLFMKKYFHLHEAYLASLNKTK